MKQPQNYLMDMDGVLVRGRTPIPGATDLIDLLTERKIPFLVITNNPLYTPRDLAHRLQTGGINIPAESIFTSALATARFLSHQKPDAKVFVIGEAGLHEAIYTAGLIMTDYQPDYVVLGETNGYNQLEITKAMRLIERGAHFIATNPDPSGPTEEGLVPACGAMAALIEKATGVSPFFVGKPNPLMMRQALNHLGVHSEDTVMIGDRMDTDIIAGVSSGMETYLVLTGVTKREEVRRFPYQPTMIFDSIADIAAILKTNLNTK